jgi:hypothetical protein
MHSVILSTSGTSELQRRKASEPQTLCASKLNAKAPDARITDVDTSHAALRVDANIEDDPEH